MAVFAIGLSAPVAGYFNDVHYAMVYLVARQLGYTPLQAYRVASASGHVDFDPQTEPVQYEAMRNGLKGQVQVPRIRFHAFMDCFMNIRCLTDAAARAQARRAIATFGAELWRTNLTDGNPGAFVHFLQDAISHKGYSSWGGHFDLIQVFNEIPETVELRVAGRLLAPATAESLFDEGFAKAAGALLDDLPLGPRTDFIAYDGRDSEMHNHRGCEAFTLPWETQSEADERCDRPAANRQMVGRTISTLRKFLEVKSPKQRVGSVEPTDIDRILEELRAANPAPPVPLTTADKQLLLTQLTVIKAAAERGGSGLLGAMRRAWESGSRWDALSGVFSLLDAGADVHSAVMAVSSRVGEVMAEPDIPAAEARLGVLLHGRREFEPYRPAAGRPAYDFDELGQLHGDALDAYTLVGSLRVFVEEPRAGRAQAVRDGRVAVVAEPTREGEQEYELQAQDLSGGAVTLGLLPVGRLVVEVSRAGRVVSRTPVLLDRRFLEVRVNTTSRAVPTEDQGDRCGVTEPDRRAFAAEIGSLRAEVGRLVSTCAVDEAQAALAKLRRSGQAFQDRLSGVWDGCAVDTPWPLDAGLAEEIAAQRSRIQATVSQVGRLATSARNATAGCQFETSRAALRDGWDALYALGCPLAADRETRAAAPDPISTAARALDETEDSLRSKEALFASEIERARAVQGELIRSAPLEAALQDSPDRCGPARNVRTAIADIRAQSTWRPAGCPTGTFEATWTDASALSRPLDTREAELRARWEGAWATGDAAGEACDVAGVGEALDRLAEIEPLLCGTARAGARQALADRRRVIETARRDAQIILREASEDLDYWMQTCDASRLRTTEARISNLERCGEKALTEEARARVSPLFLQFWGELAPHLERQRGEARTQAEQHLRTAETHLAAADRRLAQSSLTEEDRAAVRWLAGRAEEALAAAYSALTAASRAGTLPDACFADLWQRMDSLTPRAAAAAGRPSPSAATPARVPVPRVYGLGPREAATVLRSAGFQVEVAGGDPAPSDALSFRVGPTSPEAGRPEAPGTLVTMFIFGRHQAPRGPPTETPPDPQPPSPPDPPAPVTPERDPNGLARSPRPRAADVPPPGATPQRPFHVVFANCLPDAIQRKPENVSFDAFLRGLTVRDVNWSCDPARTLVLDVSGAGLQTYPAGAFLGGKRFSVPIQLGTSNPRTGQAVSFAGALLVEVSEVNEGAAPRGSNPDQSLVLAATSPDGLYSGQAHPQNSAPITLAGGPLVEGWPDAMKQANLDLMKAIAAAFNCFVATAVYQNDTTAAPLASLRRFRDEVLARTEPGRRFVDWYYRRGPRLAAAVRAQPQSIPILRIGLALLVAALDAARPGPAVAGAVAYGVARAAEALAASGGAQPAGSTSIDAAALFENLVPAGTPPESSPSIAQGAPTIEVRGEVVAVSGGLVEVRISGELLPQVGDPVVFSFEVPDVGPVSLKGEWRVSRVDGPRVTVDAAGPVSGRPQAGYLARITTSAEGRSSKDSDFTDKRSAPGGAGTAVFPVVITRQNLPVGPLPIGQGLTAYRGGDFVVRSSAERWTYYGIATERVEDFHASVRVSVRPGLGGKTLAGLLVTEHDSIGDFHIGDVFFGKNAAMLTVQQRTGDQWGDLGRGLPAAGAIDELEITRRSGTYEFRCNGRVVAQWSEGRRRRDWVMILVEAGAEANFSDWRVARPE